MAQGSSFYDGVTTVWYLWQPIVQG